MNKVLVTQNTAAPTRKQAVNLVASQLTTVALVIFAIAAPEMYSRIPAGYEMPLGSAIGGLVGFGMAYASRERA